jgi:hypothetical protein
MLQKDSKVKAKLITSNTKVSIDTFVNRLTKNRRLKGVATMTQKFVRYKFGCGHLTMPRQ